jgi:hypothetical protein
MILVYQYFIYPVCFYYLERVYRVHYNNILVRVGSELKYVLDLHNMSIEKFLGSIVSLSDNDLYCQVIFISIDVELSIGVGLCVFHGIGIGLYCYLRYCVVTDA